MLTVSWLRAYHSPWTGPVAPTLDALRAVGAVEPRDDQSLGIYDIQALRLAHIATATGPDVQVLAAWTEEGEPQAAKWTARTSLLLHASGFVVLRVTLSSADNPDLDLRPPLLRTLERQPWAPSSFSWTVQGATVTGNVRSCLNLVFLTLFNALPDSPHCADVVKAAEEGADGWEYLQTLCQDKVLSHPYPVSFGTQFEVVDDALARDEAAQQRFLANSIFSGTETVWQPQDVEGDAEGLSWYVLENQVVTFRAAPADASGLVDPTRTALLEYMTLRRAALRSVQRDSQRVLSGHLGVSRRRLQEWQHLVQTTTDDYVLSDRVGQILSLLRARTQEQPRVRDPQALEQQVRSNLATFNASLEVAGTRVTAAVGTLFAVLAATAVFAIPLQLAVDYADGGLGEEQYAVQHPLRAASLDLLVAVVAAVAFLLMLRRFNSRLKAPKLR